MKNILDVKNITVFAEKNKILTDISFSIEKGKIHSILGPNGNGKSTLLQTIMGNPDYTIKKGDIFLNDEKINEYEPNDRAKKGLFLSFQNPVEIEGVVNLDYLRNLIDINSNKKHSLVEFYRKVTNETKGLKLPENYLERHLNYGFSGGEKKVNELLQLKIISPKLALIDEIDSGLDVDALKSVGQSINKLNKEQNMSCLIVSHYDSIYKYIDVDTFHVMIGGKIVCSGKKELLTKIQKEGFDWLYKKYNIKKPEIEQTILDSCAIPQK